MLSQEEYDVLYLSAKVAVFATLFCLPLAVTLAWYLARYDFKLKFLVEAVLQLPIVLPPVVLGYLLLISFGSQGFIGQYLAKLGIHLAFNWKGAVLASMVVAFPLIVQPIRLSFQLINRQLEQVAGSLGASPFRVFYSISLPWPYLALLSAAFWDLVVVWGSLAPPLPLLAIFLMKLGPFRLPFTHYYNNPMVIQQPCD